MYDDASTAPATRLLHHYTAYRCLGSIAKLGLVVGEVPLTHRQIEHAISLTDDLDPGGHGLDPIKREVRVTVALDAGDPNLHHWPAWATQRLKPGFFGS